MSSPVIQAGTLSLVAVKSREEKQHQAERERTAMLERVLELSKRDYDEFMRKHMQEMRGVDDTSVTDTGGGSQAIVAAAGNSVQEKIPELYAAIRKWQDNLEPLLEEQNARPLFDLDDYLVSILDKLKTAPPMTAVPPARDNSPGKDAINDFLRNVGMDDLSEDDQPVTPRDAPGMAGLPESSVSSFEDLVRGEPKWNVCRLFLSTLILTNNGNVEIFGDPSQSMVTDQSEGFGDGDVADGDVTPRGSGSNALIPVSTQRGTTPGGVATPLRGSQTFGASKSFQVKLKNADKNLKLAVQDNASAVVGSIITNANLPPLEPIGEVPFANDD